MYDVLDDWTIRASDDRFQALPESDKARLCRWLESEGIDPCFTTAIRLDEGYLDVWGVRLTASKIVRFTDRKILSAPPPPGLFGPGLT